MYGDAIEVDVGRCLHFHVAVGGIHRTGLVFCVLGVVDVTTDLDLCEVVGMGYHSHDVVRRDDGHAEDGSLVELHVVAVAGQFAVGGVDEQLYTFNGRSYGASGAFDMHTGEAGGPVVLPAPLGVDVGSRSLAVVGD